MLGHPHSVAGSRHLPVSDPAEAVGSDGLTTFMEPKLRALAVPVDLLSPRTRSAPTARSTPRPTVRNEDRCPMHEDRPSGTSHYRLHAAGFGGIRAAVVSNRAPRAPDGHPRSAGYTRWNRVRSMVDVTNIMLAIRDHTYGSLTRAG